MIIPILIIISKFVGTYSNEGTEQFAKLIDEIGSTKSAEIGILEMRMAKINQLIGLALQIGEEERDSIVQEFCEKQMNGIANRENKPNLHVDECITKIVDKLEPDYIDRTVFGRKGTHLLPRLHNSSRHSQQLLEWVLLPKQILWVKQMHEVLSANFVDLNKAEVVQMDVLLEVLLTRSHDQMLKITALYKKKYGQKIQDALRDKKMWRGEKRAARAAIEILANRLDMLNKRAESVEQIADEIFEMCKQWQPAAGNIYETIEAVAIDGQQKPELSEQNANKREEEKLPEDSDIETIFEKVKNLLAYFEPNSSEAENFASQWLVHCDFVTNHAFAHWKHQRYFDEIGRMMTVANLFTPNSRATYFREKMVTALEKENNWEFNWMIASQNHGELEIRELASSEFGQCLFESIGRKRKQSSGLKVNNLYLKTLAYIFKVNNGAKLVHSANVQSADNEDDSNTNKCLNPIAFLPGKMAKIVEHTYSEISQKNVEENLKNIVDRHNQISLPRQQKILKVLGRLIRNSIKPWCQRRVHFWQFWRSRELKEKEPKSEIKMLKNILVEDFCALEKEMGEHGRWDNPAAIIEWFLNILNLLENEPAKLKAFNRILKLREWPKLQKTVHFFLRMTKLYAKFENTELEKVFTGIVNPSEAGELQATDIGALIRWYKEHFNPQLEMHQIELKGQEGHDRRRRKRFIIILFPTTSMLIAYIQTVIIFLLIFSAIACPLGCLFADGNLIVACLGALIRAIFYILWLVIIEGLLGSN